MASALSRRKEHRLGEDTREPRLVRGGRRPKSNAVPEPRRRDDVSESAVFQGAHSALGIGQVETPNRACLTTLESTGRSLSSFKVVVSEIMAAVGTVAFALYPNEAATR